MSGMLGILLKLNINFGEDMGIITTSKLNLSDIMCALVNVTA
jgi:hypothetical protein